MHAPPSAAAVASISALGSFIGRRKRCASAAGPSDASNKSANAAPGAARPCVMSISAVLRHRASRPRPGQRHPAHRDAERRMREHAIGLTPIRRTARRRFRRFRRPRKTPWSAPCRRHPSNGRTIMRRGLRLRAIARLQRDARARGPKPRRSRRTRRAGSSFTHVLHTQQRLGLSPSPAPRAASGFM